MVVSFVLVLILFESTHTKDAHIVTMLHKITLWSPFAGYLIDVLFILNFVDEIRTSKTEHANVISQKFLTGISGAFVIAAVVLTITTARSLITERNLHIDWRDLNALQANGLVALAGGAQTYVDSKGDSLHYILIKPQDYDTQKKYPLVVCLPYGGYEAGAAVALSSDVNRHTYHAFIFVPFCPEGEGWGGISGYPSMESLVYEAISKLNEPAVDTKRRYVTGISRGGFGTWEFICTRPDLFAAAVPVCGRGDPDLASKVINMPIWAFHGAQDKNVPVSGSRDMIAAIKKAGGHPLYTEYPNSAHDIWENVTETPDVWNWLFAQKQQ
jgi:predicted peptidase